MPKSKAGIRQKSHQEPAMVGIVAIVGRRIRRGSTQYLAVWAHSSEFSWEDSNVLKSLEVPAELISEFEHYIYTWSYYTPLTESGIADQDFPDPGETSSTLRRQLREREEVLVRKRGATWPAIVRHVSVEHVNVHYVGWHKEFDENLVKNGHAIAGFVDKLSNGVFEVDAKTHQDSQDNQEPKGTVIVLGSADLADEGEENRIGSVDLANEQDRRGGHASVTCSPSVSTPLRGGAKGAGEGVGELPARGTQSRDPSSLKAQPPPKRQTRVKTEASSMPTPKIEVVEPAYRASASPDRANALLGSLYEHYAVGARVTSTYDDVQYECTVVSRDPAKRTVTLLYDLDATHQTVEAPNKLVVFRHPPRRPGPEELALLAGEGRKTLPEAPRVGDVVATAFNRRWVVVSLLKDSDYVQLRSPGGMLSIRHVGELRMPTTDELDGFNTFRVKTVR